MESTNNTPKQKRDHLWKKGESGNLNGRPKMTEAEKLEAKAKRDFVKEYKDSLRESLDLISPVLIATALEGDIRAIKEINDRVMGKAKETVEVQGGLSISFDSAFDEQDV